MDACASFGPCRGRVRWQLLQPWSWSRHPPNADSWAGGRQGLQQLSRLNTGEHGRVSPALCFVLRRCVRAVAICILPRGLFLSAPFFNVCGGDKHPAAHVFNPEQARLERAFVCWGGCFSAAFPCAPFQRWRRASCRTWASSFCSAVASSNLPRSTSYTKNKQLQLIVFSTNILVKTIVLLYRVVPSGSDGTDIDLAEAIPMELRNTSL